MPAKTVHDLIAADGYIRAYTDRNPNAFMFELHLGEPSPAERHRREGGGGSALSPRDGHLRLLWRPDCNAWEVMNVHAKKGWGPLLHDLAMEWAYPQPIIADRMDITPAATKIWEHYLKHRRSDVEFDYISSEGDVDLDRCGEWDSEDYDARDYRFYAKGQKNWKFLVKAGRVLRQDGTEPVAQASVSAMAWPKPHDAWKTLRGGILPTPTEFEGHEKVWKRIAQRLGFDYGKGVQQRAPVIGGRRRYHHRPLTTWRLPQRKGHLTLTTDEMEAKSWNRLKGKLHVAMPRVKDVFEVRLRGNKKFWAIHHEALTWPPDDDWYRFIDTFFRWRAMAKDALKPAKPTDLKEFLEWILIPEEADAKAQKRRRQDVIIPFKLKQKRDAKVDEARKLIWEDPGLQEKVRWVKSTLKFLKANNIKHADFDPSNLGKTMKGRTVITNIAESRSRGKKVGRIGRVSSGSAVSAAGAPNRESGMPRKHISDSPFGPSTVPDILQTVQACHQLAYPDSPIPNSVHMLSGSGRRTFGLIHLDRHMRTAVLEAVFGLGLPASSVEKGLKRLKAFADKHGEKAWKVYQEAAKKLRSAGKVTAAMNKTNTHKVHAYRYGYGYGGPVDRKAAAKKAALTRKMQQVPVDVTINGKTVKGYFSKYGTKIDEEMIQFRSKKALMKLGDLPMVNTINIEPDGGELPSVGTTSLRKLIPNARSVYLRKGRGSGSWQLSVSPHSNQYWQNAEPLKVAVRKTAVPEPIDFGQMAASLSGAEMVEAVSNLLDDPTKVSASVQQSPARVALVSSAFKDQDIKLAVFLASNGIPLDATGESIRASATKGLKKLRASAPKLGRQGGELFNATMKVLGTGR